MKKIIHKSTSSLKKFLISFLLVVFIGGIGMSYELYTRVYQPNIAFANDNNVKYIYIPTNSDFIDVVKLLSENGLLINANSFSWLAKKKKYVNNIKPGRYKIDKPLNNNELVNLLRSGNQVPVNVTFNNIRTKEDLVGNISNQIEADSLSLLSYITDSAFQHKLGLNNDNVVSIFIPNTYEFYWNTSASQYVNRMLKEYYKFWNERRKIQSKKIGLNYYQVSVLASIVEKEQNIRVDERPKIARLYLNRIKKDMKLESDPTLIFALKDFTIKSVLNNDKKLFYPFNTYKNMGLPPGPICIPSISSIDAVLNPADHEYIFMCAKEDFSGYHNFARTYTKHLINARRYQKALNKRNIMR